MIFVFALLGLFSFIGTSQVDGVQVTDVLTRPGFHYVQRPRLGHFKNEPYTDLYKTYAVAFVLPAVRRERDDDDHRNYAPAGEECVLFFNRFRMDVYKPRDLDDMVMLDACLGYLYESTFHDEDKEANKMLKDNLDELIADEKLKAIYDGTKVDSAEAFGEAGQDCIGDTLWNAIKLKRQYKEIECNNHWLQLFIDFAKCHRSLPANARDEDTYANMLYDLVKTRGQICFDAEIYLINEAVRKNYANNPLYRASNTFSLKNLRKQSKKRMWPKEIAQLFGAVQGTKHEINLREIHAILKGTIEQKGQFATRLLTNLATAADAYVKPVRGTTANNADPTGYKRYEDMVDKMCNFFRSSDNLNYYDYATAFTRLVEVLEFEEVFGISPQYFLTNVLNSCEESGAMYLAVFSCNVLTFTQAQFQRTAGNSPLSYDVFFKPDTSKMVRWPRADFF